MGIARKNGRGGSGGNSQSPSHELYTISGATACPWLPQMLLGLASPSQNPGRSLNCSIQLAHAEGSTHRRHISFITQLLPITERPQETESIPVGICPGKELAVPQRASLSHPKAPGRTLPNQTTRTERSRIPREVVCRVSLTTGLRRFLNPVVRRHCLQDTYLLEPPGWPGFPHWNYRPESPGLAV